MHPRFMPVWIAEAKNYNTTFSYQRLCTAIQSNVEDQDSLTRWSGLNILHALFSEVATKQQAKMHYLGAD